MEKTSKSKAPIHKEEDWKEVQSSNTKPDPKKKYWIHSVQTRTNESWLADSRAFVHVTNSCLKMIAQSSLASEER